MKLFKKMTSLLFAIMIAFTMNAQTTPASATATKTTTTQTTKATGDARTKTGDKINKTLKGPNNETVYTGSKGGNYYLDKNGNKKYLPKK
jgi:colicin import membrane protein